MEEGFYWYRQILFSRARGEEPCTSSYARSRRGQWQWPRCATCATSPRRDTDTLEIGLSRDVNRMKTGSHTFLQRSRFGHGALCFITHAGGCTHNMCCYAV